MEGNNPQENPQEKQKEDEDDEHYGKRDSR